MFLGMTQETITGDFHYAYGWGDKSTIQTTNSLDVAPSGKWGIRCGQGKHWTERKPVDVALDVFSRDMFHCPEGHGIERLDAGLAILPEDATLATDPNAVFGRDWWHVSRSDALTIDPKGFFHVGSEEAARQRAVTFSPVYDHFLYRVSFDPAAVVDPRVLLEFSPNQTLEDSFAMSVDASPDVTRYVNVREAPGSVSLILRPSAVVSLELVESFPKRVRSYS